MLSRQKRDPTFPTDQIPDHIAKEIDDWREENRIIEKHLLDLDKIEQLAIRLRFFRGQTQQEVANRIGKSKAGARRIIERSLAKLRRGFEQDGLTYEEFFPEF